MMPQTRPGSTHSSPVFRASSDPTANDIGMVMPTSPAIRAGGWKNIPKWVSSGLMPSPSAGTKGSFSKGLAMTAVTARKNVSTSIMTPVVYGRASRTRSGARQMAMAAMTERTIAMYSSEPSLPA